MIQYIMAVDQGTTGSRVMIVDRQGQIMDSAYAEFPQIYPKPGWVEHDPEVIWETTLKMMQKALASSSVPTRNIAGIGITNQRETTVVWEKDTLKPVHNAIVWQCRRSASICEKLKAAGLENEFRNKSGLLLDAYQSGVPGGTGESFDWSRVPKNIQLATGKAVILAGGLNSSNVGEAISIIKPYAVDVSGGIESEKGVKDQAKMASFIAAVRAADESTTVMKNR